MALIQGWYWYKAVFSTIADGQHINPERRVDPFFGVTVCSRYSHLLQVECKIMGTCNG
jgi:hypothetical protein